MPGIEGVVLEVVVSRSWRRDAEISAGKCGVAILYLMLWGSYPNSQTFLSDSESILVGLEKYKPQKDKSVLREVG